MTNAVKPIPEGYHAVTPYLTVKNGGALVEFLEKAFGATVESRMDLPNDDLWHADVQIGDSHVMIGGASEEWPEKPAQIYLYVEDADATYKRALDAGATSIMEPADMFYGDRHGGGDRPLREQLVDRHSRRGRGAGRAGEAGESRGGEAREGRRGLTRETALWPRLRDPAL